jgi:adenine C2-methylase RlmN of 23S rRNA A2503 and tRNA A37
VFHHLFLAGFNDSLADVGDLVALLRSHGLEGREFRVLRYNPAQAADGSVPYRETDARRFDECVAALAAALPRVKVQISTGTDVLAACGQFVATCRTAA